MRTRNVMPRVEKPRIGKHRSLYPETSTSSSSCTVASSSNPNSVVGVSSTPVTHRITPSDFDTTSTPRTPPHAVRRSLSYSPTKKFQYRRTYVILLGLILLSVFLTMLCTLLLLGKTTPIEPDHGPAFGNPEYHPLAGRRIGGQPRMRKGTQTTDSSSLITNVVRPRADQEEMPEADKEDDEDDFADSSPDTEQKGAYKANDLNVHEVFSPDWKHWQGTLQLPDMHAPRVVFFEPDNPPRLNTDRVLEEDPMLHAPPGFEAAPQDRMKTDYTDGDCVPMHEWQTKSFPNCNLVHEYDLRAAGPGVYKNNTNMVLEDTLLLLGQGWFRHTWRLDIGSSKERVVLKTLRLEREFYDEFYDLHRRDAVAMERLTHSPFIMDIYGYCGQSALNELADFGDGLLASLEKVDRQMRYNRHPDVYLLKLQLATGVAVGVAHIHEIDGDNHRPSMVHYDLNPRNVAIVGNGKPKINDFNIAAFLHWNPKTNETCGFHSRLHEPWWRAPEEVAVDDDDEVDNISRPLLNEKVDVYALGSLIFHILTTHSPRGKMKKDRIEEIREKVARGEPPVLEEEYAKSKDPAVVAFKRAMDRCFEPDPRNRGSAREVADILLTALTDIKAKRRKKDGRRKKQR